MTRDPKPTENKPEAYHREQQWVFRACEKKNGYTDTWGKIVKAKAKTLESAMKQLRVRFPEDKYELTFVKMEPINHEATNRYNRSAIVNQAVRSSNEYIKNFKKHMKEV